MSCPFCELDYRDISNTIIEETDNFFVLPSKGSLCDGYLLIVPKLHTNSINELTETQKIEIIKTINKYREKFFQIYGKFPIFFEHGSADINNSISSSSVTHAHMHIVNHNFSHEQEIINKLNLTKVSKNEFFINTGKNYISYISPKGDFYISYNFSPVSQQMRIYIANDLGLNEKYNWKTTNFETNIISTINNFMTK